MNHSGQLLCGASEIQYLLLLVLMAKGYTITRARLKVAFTVKLTVFVCTYTITYTSLFIYQAKVIYMLIKILSDNIRQIYHFLLKTYFKFKIQMCPYK